MIVADTSVWVDYLDRNATPQAAILDALLDEPEFAMGDLVIMEVLRGIRHEERLARVARDFASYEVLAMAPTPVVLKSAEHCRFLRSRGISIGGTIDCLIATFCITGRHQLLHADRDFDAFEQYLDLQVFRGF